MKDGSLRRLSRKLIPLKIAITYLILAGLWVWLSDRMLLAFGADAKTITQLHTAKGLFFVVATAGIVYLVIANNVADIVRSANALLASEERFRRHYEAISAGIVVHDISGTMVYANSAAGEILGMAPGYLVGRASVSPQCETVREDGSPFPVEEHPSAETLRTGQPVRNVVMGMCTDGPDEARWILVNSEPIPEPQSGEVKEALSTFLDITELKRTQEALQSGETLFRQFVEYTPAAVAMFDKDMRYLLTSRRWLTDYKIAEQDLTGRYHYEVFPETPERWKEVHRRCLQGAVERSDEDPFPRADGSLDWVRWEVRPWRDNHSSIGGIIIFTEVITERKRAEEELRRRTEREREIQEEAEEGKRQFYKGTIFSVTEGKLNLISHEEAGKLLVPDTRDITINDNRDLSVLRNTVEKIAREAGMSEVRTCSLVTAVGEAAANAIKHADGGVVRIGVSGDKMQVCVLDQGTGMDALVLPKATLMTRFSTKPSMGLGYSLILASVDKVYLATDKSGTCVLMEKAIPEPSDEISISDLPDIW